MLNKLNITIFIDESGTLPDPKDKVVIVAAVGTNIISQLTSVTKTIRKTRDAKKLSEIKFYRAGDKTKTKFLKTLANKNIDIFVLIVEKQGKSIKDSPENFAILCWQLIEECKLLYQNNLKKIIFDRHFHRLIDQEEFDLILTKLLKKKFAISHVDSQKVPAVNSADMIAGSVLWATTNKNDKFYQLIKEKIIVEKTISWKKIARKFWQTKTRSNQRKRPSKTS
ncbi:DUF3800 domain-containing protein [Patescibacteria group bacterium]|nr:DUF3800 domain-containing protein [Patescibacteria group bacterium]